MWEREFAEKFAKKSGTQATWTFARQGKRTQHSHMPWICQHVRDIVDNHIHGDFQVVMCSINRNINIKCMRSGTDETQSNLVARSHEQV
jgi:hypothetical protein